MSRAKEEEKFSVAITIGGGKEQNVTATNPTKDDVVQNDVRCSLVFVSLVAVFVIRDS